MIKKRQSVLVSAGLLLAGLALSTTGQAVNNGKVASWQYTVFGKGDFRQHVASISTGMGTELAIFCTETSQWPALMLYSPNANFRQERAGIIRLSVGSKRSELTARYKNYTAFSPDVTAELMDQLKQGNYVSIVRELPGGKTRTLRMPLKRSSMALNALASHCNM
ncbi:hypothetical protein ACWJJH_19360 [Endozoicomonadaceae bacterium StTr2]